MSWPAAGVRRSQPGLRQLGSKPGRQHDEKIRLKGIPLDTAQTGYRGLNVFTRDVKAQRIAKTDAEALSELRIQ